MLGIPKMIIILDVKIGDYDRAISYEKYLKSNLMETVVSSNYVSKDLSISESFKFQYLSSFVNRKINSKLNEYLAICGYRQIN